MQTTTQGHLRSRIQPETLEPALELHGLDADQVVALLRGQACPRVWHPGLNIGIDNPSATAHEHPEIQKIDLPDGTVRMHSGNAASVEVTDTHRLGKTLLPQSLHLALSQQWARSGVMMMHAACFEFGGVTTLVVGRKAAGKSILSMAALAAGGHVVSDDWLLVGLDRNGQPNAERLREFLMLREGWAGATLAGMIGDLPTRNTGARPKRTIALHEVPAQKREKFPITKTIDRVWQLRRPPAGRSRHTRSAPLAGQHALASIIESTMPLLYGANFSEERSRLMKTAALLTRCCHLLSVETGTDLIEQPRPTLERLLSG